MAIPVITVDEYIETRSTFDPSTSDNIKLIAQATCETGFHCSETLTNKAIALKVMHWLTLAANGAQSSGSTGSAKSLKEGDLSISFASTTSTSMGDQYLSSTPYGLELIELGKQCFLTPLNRMVKV